MLSHEKYYYGGRSRSIRPASPFLSWITLYNVYDRKNEGSCNKEQTLKIGGVHAKTIIECQEIQIISYSNHWLVGLVTPQFGCVFF